MSETKLTKFVATNSVGDNIWVCHASDADARIRELEEACKVLGAEVWVHRAFRKRLVTYELKFANGENHDGSPDTIGTFEAKIVTGGGAKQAVDANPIAAAYVRPRE